MYLSGASPLSCVKDEGGKTTIRKIYVKEEIELQIYEFQPHK